MRNVYQPPVHISDQVRQSAIATIGTYFEKINGVDRVTLGEAHVDPHRYLQNVRELEGWVPLRGKKVLEIGSGYGVSLAIMLKQFGADAVGAEPASEGFDASFQTARTVLVENGLDASRLVDAVGESLPFADASFDVVYSNNVIEHTQDPRKVLMEAARVLKPGGTLYVEVPNYWSYFEGHYLVPQPPILWRSLLPAWIRWVCRRDPAFALTLRTEINPVWLRRRMREVASIYPLHVVTLGESRFLSRFARPFEFQTESMRRTGGAAVALLQRLNWGNWIGQLLVLVRGYYPIVMVARRL